MKPQSGVVMEMTSADILSALDKIHGTGICLWDIRTVDELTLQFTLRKTDVPKMTLLAEQKGYHMRYIGEHGTYWKSIRLFRHRVLIAGILSIVLLTLWIPTRVLFIQVEGNSVISSNRILDAVNDCGITFGSKREDIRSEQLKNTLLDLIPQLQWVGVNTKGCVAIISVRERTEPVPGTKASIGNIVARFDGVVDSCTVLRGKLLCRPGQTVRAGQILISGYTDCAGAILATRAEGEVIAETKHRIVVKTLSHQQSRGAVRDRFQKYAVRILKKQINFYKDSGILDGSCVKMEKEYYLKLPGGFCLPISLVVQEWTIYDLVEQDADTESVLRTFAEDYLLKNMVAGRILEKQENIDQDTLYGNYLCLEMIGQFQ